MAFFDDQTPAQTPFPSPGKSGSTSGQPFLLPDLQRKTDPNALYPIQDTDGSIVPVTWDTYTKMKQAQEAAVDPSHGDLGQWGGMGGGILGGLIGGAGVGLAGGPAAPITVPMGSALGAILGAFGGATAGARSQGDSWARSLKTGAQETGMQALGEGTMGLANQFLFKPGAITIAGKALDPSMALLDDVRIPGTEAYGPRAAPAGDKKAYLARKLLENGVGVVGTPKAVATNAKADADLVFRRNNLFRANPDATVDPGLAFDSARPDLQATFENTAGRYTEGQNAIEKLRTDLVTNPKFGRDAGRDVPLSASGNANVAAQAPGVAKPGPDPLSVQIDSGAPVDLGHGKGDKAFIDSLLKMRQSDPEMFKIISAAPEAQAALSGLDAPAVGPAAPEGPTREFKPTVPAKAAQDMVTQTYRDTNYSQDPALFDVARKRFLGQTEGQVQAAVPGIKPINDEMSWRIPLGKVLNAQQFAMGRRPPVDWKEAMGGMAGLGLAGATSHPYMAGLGALAFAQRPTNLSRLANTLWAGAGGQVPQTAVNLFKTAGFGAGNRAVVGNLPRLTQYLLGGGQ